MAHTRLVIYGRHIMTITLSPDQERAIREAIRAGQITSVEELIQRAIAGLPKRGETPTASSSVFERAWVYLVVLKTPLCSMR